MSGEGEESVLPFLGGPTSILRRKYASQRASPRGKSTGRPGNSILGSVIPGPHLRNDRSQGAASASEQPHRINQSARADSPRLGGLRARAEDSVVNPLEGPSRPRSLASVRPMPVVPAERDCLDGYSLEEYIHSPYTSDAIPQETWNSPLSRSSLAVAANSDPKLSGRQPVSGTLIPSQEGGSLVVGESDTNNPPMQLMKHYCASFSDECPSASVSYKSVVLDEVAIFDFERMSEPEEGRRSMEATKSPRSDPGAVAGRGGIKFNEALLASCGHLPRVSPSFKPLDLGLSLNTGIEKVTVNDPDPSFRRAVGSRRRPVEEAFVEQVGSAFQIKNLKNDSLGRLPQITPVERSFSEHGSPELTAIEESSPEGYRYRRSESFSSNSSNETIRPGARNAVILPGGSDSRCHSNYYRRSQGEVDIGSAASMELEGEGWILPPDARHRGATAPEGPIPPPASPATPADTALPEVEWVRAASEEFSSPSFSLLRKEKGSVVLERKPFPPGQGGSSSQGIHPAPPIKTKVLCCTNVLPEQPRIPTPVLAVSDGGSGQPDSPPDSPEFSSVEWSRVSVASSMLHASGCAGGSEGSRSLRSVKALLLNEGIQLKEDDARSGNGMSGEASREDRSLRTIQS